MLQRLSPEKMSACEKLFFEPPSVLIEKPTEKTTKKESNEIIVTFFPQIRRKNMTEKLFYSENEIFSDTFLDISDQTAR